MQSLQTITSNFIPLRIYEVIAIFGILCVVLYTVTANEGSDNLISYISIYAGVSFRLLPSVNSLANKWWVRLVPAAAVTPAPRVGISFIGPKASVAGLINPL